MMLDGCCKCYLLPGNVEVKILIVCCLYKQDGTRKIKITKLYFIECKGELKGSIMVE